MVKDRGEDRVRQKTWSNKLCAEVEDICGPEKISLKVANESAPQKSIPVSPLNHVIGLQF